MSELKLKGKVKKFLEPLKTDKILKSTVIIETDDTYPVEIAIDFIAKPGDERKEKSLGFFNKLAIGAVVEFDVNVRSSEYNGKYFTNITAWKFSTEGGLPEVPKQKGMAPNKEFDNAVPPPVADDELPF